MASTDKRFASREGTRLWETGKDFTTQVQRRPGQNPATRFDRERSPRDAGLRLLKDETVADEKIDNRTGGDGEDVRHEVVQMDGADERPHQQ